MGHSQVIPIHFLEPKINPKICKFYKSLKFGYTILKSLVLLGDYYGIRGTNAPTNLRANTEGG